jgi:hypothetical protein
VPGFRCRVRALAGSTPAANASATAGAPLTWEDEPLPPMVRLLLRASLHDRRQQVSRLVQSVIRPIMGSLTSTVARPFISRIVEEGSARKAGENNSNMVAAFLTAANRDAKKEPVPISLLDFSWRAPKPRSPSNGF